MNHEVGEDIDQVVCKVGARFSAIDLGVGIEKRVLEEQAMTYGTRMKRVLNISPDTLVGSPRKYCLHEPENFNHTESKEKFSNFSKCSSVDHQNQHLAVRRLFYRMREVC